MATVQEITKILITLFSVLPPKGTSGSDHEAAISGYLLALDGVEIGALKWTAAAIIKGEIADMSVKACPTAPELAREVRKRMAAERQRQLAGTAAIEAPPPRQKPSEHFKALNAEFQAWRNGAPAGPLMLAAFEKHFPAKDTAR
jgi:hypothetical protein